MQFFSHLWSRFAYNQTGRKPFDTAYIYPYLGSVMPRTR